MKKFFQSVANFFKKVINVVKNIFITKEPIIESSDEEESSEEESSSSEEESSNSEEESSDDESFDSEEESFEESSDEEQDIPSIDKPIYSKRIRKGEIGGYITYDKRRNAAITKEFVQNVKDLGIDLVYLNTPREKQDPDTWVYFDEWLEIFNKFENSGVKLMLYIYEAVGGITPRWTDEQIKTISNHPAFYSWIAQDEVSYKSYNAGSAWIKKLHAQTWGDGTRKWPNMAICYLPKLDSLNADSIGETYEEYLELWKDAVDLTHADMYPFISTQVNGAQYDIESDGKAVHSKTSGGEKWFSYLKSHCRFCRDFYDRTHRLYMNSCKHIGKDNKDRPYISRPKPTLLPLQIQACANLMAGSNGLMLFVLGDIFYGKSQFIEAAFNDKLEINPDTYNLLKSIFNNHAFKNFKNIIVNLKVFDVFWGDSSEVGDFILEDSPMDNLLVSIARNNDYCYAFFLNTSLTEDAIVKLRNDVQILNFEKLTVEKPRECILKPGELVCAKYRIISVK